MELLAKIGFFCLATPAVWRAAWRARGLLRRLPLDDATHRLARAPRWRLGLLDRPTWLAGVVERWLPLLPPWGHGPCLKRSLILLDLWGRSGLAPKLHLGMHKRGEQRAFHAWVEASGISVGAGETWSEIWAQPPTVAGSQDHAPSQLLAPPARPG